MLAQLIDFILQEKSPIDLIKKRIKMGANYNKPDLTEITQIISMLIRRTNFIKQPEKNQDIKVCLN